MSSVSEHIAIIQRQSEEDKLRSRKAKEINQDEAFSIKVHDFLKAKGFTRLEGYELDRMEDLWMAITYEFEEWNEETMNWLNEKDDISTNDVGRSTTRARYYG